MNRISRIISVLLIVLSVSVLSFGQGKKQYYEAYIALGDTCFAHANYFGAHQAYEKALAYVDNPNIAFKCAEACRGYQNYPDAEKYYRIAISEDSVTFHLANYWFAEMLKLQGKYDSAKVQYEIHCKMNKTKNDYYTKKAKDEITVLEKKIAKVGESVGLEVKRIPDLDVNSMYAEYAPCQYNDSLFFFAGVRPLDAKLADTSFIFANYLTKVMQATRHSDSTWSDVKVVKSLDDPDAHVNNLSFTKDGKMAYFSKCIGYDCAIYRADFNPETVVFSNITRLPAPINMSQSSNTTPQIAYTPEGDYLFFASNRKGTKGGYDIWYSKMESDGSFGAVENCSKNVNTIGDEVTPFFDSRDSLLYFSSEWHTSLGGFDIFTSKGDLKSGRWSPAVNIGTPINSSYNDLYYAYSRDTLRAYWCSNREESVKLIGKAFSNDIYSHSLVRRSIARITDLIPITLYFDNDYPDPRSKDSVTDKVYEHLYHDFMAKKDEYIKEYTKYSPSERYKYDVRTVETFFNDLQEEYEKLALFAELMDVILHDGQDIVVAFKGYASPVGNLAYNEIVAKKRISCIQNYFMSFKDGSLNQFLHNEPKSGKGSLKYIYEPIGVVKAENTFYTSSGEQVSAISDRRQKWMSVYSPAAAYQRKIEIIAVDIEYEDELFEEIKHEITTQKKMVDEVEGTSLYKPGEEPAETHAEPKSGGGNSSAIIFIDEEDEDFNSQPASQPSNVQTKPQTAVQPKPAAKPQSAPAPKPTKPAAKPSPVIEMAPMDFEEDEDDYPRTRTQAAPVEEPAPVYYQEQEMKKYDGEEIFKAK
ncbi:MAG: PD40 domain-containing protein [Bacteroidales bacterium]|nr:PD40 domain-containing protein [Bacteroidales bacterium]